MASVACPVVYTDSGDSEEAENECLRVSSGRFSHRLPHQVIYRGMLLNEVVTPRGLEALSQLQLEREDVLICGYPKSGTSWLYEILHLILCETKRAETCSKRSQCKSRLLWLDDEREHADMETCKPHPRILKTHVPVSLLPPTAFTNNTKIFLAIRNPKDVAVSYFYFHRLCEDFGDFQVELPEFLEMFRAGYVHWGSWTRHIQEWWTCAQKHGNVFPVFYEESKYDSHLLVRSLADILGVKLSEDDVNLIVEMSSFSSMKARSKSQFSLLFRRKGEVGDWKNHFSEKQSDEFDTWVKGQVHHHELLVRLQYQL